MNQKKNGEFISRQRKLQNLTQEQLANRMGVSINAVSKWERGLSFPDVSLYKDLCSELNITIEELINGEKDSSIEAKDKALINTVKSKDKIKRKLYLLVIVSSIIIILLIIGIFYLYKSEEDKLQEYYDRNLEKTYISRDIDAMLKYRNEGKYPDYYGGIYISEDAYFLILQIVKEKIPKEGTREYQYYNELITLNSSIKIEYVKNSYNDLEDINNKLTEYFTTHEVLEDLNSWGIDIIKNNVMVNFVEVTDDIIKNFRENILDSDLIEFISAIDYVDDSKKCTNYLDTIGDEPLDRTNIETLISIEIVTSDYIPVLLSLYDNGTYELFTAYKECKPGKVCNSMLIYTKSIKGTYNYDVKKIIEASTNRDNFNYTEKNKPKYTITLGEKFIEEYDTIEFVVEKNKKNKYLEELLKSINVDLTKCAKPEYID